MSALPTSGSPAGAPPRSHLSSNSGSVAPAWKILLYHFDSDRDRLFRKASRPSA
jgi:hypothetical protein